MHGSFYHSSLLFSPRFENGRRSPPTHSDGDSKNEPAAKSAAGASLLSCIVEILLLMWDKWVQRRDTCINFSSEARSKSPFHLWSCRWRQLSASTRIWAYFCQVGSLNMSKQTQIFIHRSQSALPAVGKKHFFTLIPENCGKSLQIHLCYSSNVTSSVCCSGK